MRAFLAELGKAISVIIIFLAILALSLAIVCPNEMHAFLWGAMHHAGDATVTMWEHHITNG